MVPANTMKLILIAAFVTLCALLVNAYPQLQFDDQRESPDEDALTRTRRGSQALQGSFGHHHQQTYHPPTSYGGHGQASSSFGSSLGSGHGSGHGHGWSSGGHGHQAVGPVFTFVRTDYNGNFQWGVRHKAGGGSSHGHGHGLYPQIIRIRRGDHGHHHGYDYLGPVYTYAKTDYHANFKWGVRHHVGGYHG